MKKRTFILFVTLMTGFYLAGGPSFAQQKQSVDVNKQGENEKVNKLKQKVHAAKNLIEDKGEKAFHEFNRDADKWTGAEHGIYVAEAKHGIADKGKFVVYPPPEDVGENALHMPMVNGRPFIKAAAEGPDTEEVDIFRFTHDPSGADFHYASVVAVTPGGRPYVVGAGTDNFLMQKYFVMELVNAGCALIMLEGKNCFPLLQDKNSVFRFEDTFVSVLGGDGNVLLDPGVPQVEDIDVWDLPPFQSPGHYPVIAASMDKALEMLAAGSYPRSREEFIKNWKAAAEARKPIWSAYYFPKPGGKKLSRKISYEKAVEAPDGKVYIVVSGIYLAD